MSKKKSDECPSVETNEAKERASLASEIAKLSIDGRNRTSNDGEPISIEEAAAIMRVSVRSVLIAKAKLEGKPKPRRKKTDRR
jgi:hypothetical protein